MDHFRATIQNARTRTLGRPSPHTRAAATASKHLRAYHPNKLLRSAIADADKRKKRRENMNAAAKVADPSRTVDGGAQSLGLKVLPRAGVAEARKMNTRRGMPERARTEGLLYLRQW